MERNQTNRRTRADQKHKEADGLIQALQEDISDGSNAAFANSRIQVRRVAQTLVVKRAPAATESGACLSRR